MDATILAESLSSLSGEARKWKQIGECPLRLCLKTFRVGAPDGIEGKGAIGLIRRVGRFILSLPAEESPSLPWPMLKDLQTAPIAAGIIVIDWVDRWYPEAGIDVRRADPNSILIPAVFDAADKALRLLERLLLAEQETAVEPDALPVVMQPAAIGEPAAGPSRHRTGKAAAALLKKALATIEETARRQAKAEGATSERAEQIASQAGEEFKAHGWRKLLKRLAKMGLLADCEIGNDTFGRKLGYQATEVLEWGPPKRAARSPDWTNLPERTAATAPARAFAGESATSLVRRVSRAKPTANRMRCFNCQGHAVEKQDAFCEPCRSKYGGKLDRVRSREEKPLYVREDLTQEQLSALRDACDGNPNLDPIEAIDLIPS